jgi:hypothetical protein
MKSPIIIEQTFSRSRQFLDLIYFTCGKDGGGGAS